MKFAAFLLAAAAALQAGEPGLVVMDFQGRGILDKAVLRQLWDRTWDIASQYPSVKVVSMQETRQRLFDQNVLVPTSCTDICFQRIAAKMQASELLIPSVEKTGDQLKFNFVLVKGASGKRIKDATVWSDGRVDRAIAAGVIGVMGEAGSSSSAGLGSGFWKALATVGLAAGANIVLGVTQDRSVIIRTKAPTKPNSPDKVEVGPGA
ncbi:MAG: hypothetical protein IPK50_02115 [Fibrobacterota bacterium]|nr:hypothetical protein [Fibrobacterota bacterium]QQS05694.1 MAG: hypothetical protein IPK50_02115 [Fibrobacterota bacterium]